MAALTATTLTKGAPRAGRLSYAVKASTTIYAGGLVCTDTSGYLVPMADVVGNRFAGLALETVTVGATLATPPVECRVNDEGMVLKGLVRSGTTIADVNALLYAPSDNPNDLTSAASTNVKSVATIIRCPSSGIMDVQLFTSMEHLAIY